MSQIATTIPRFHHPPQIDQPLLHGCLHEFSFHVTIWQIANGWEMQAKCLSKKIIPESKFESYSRFAMFVNLISLCTYQRVWRFAILQLFTALDKHVGNGFARKIFTLETIYKLRVMHPFFYFICQH